MNYSVDWRIALQFYADEANYKQSYIASKGFSVSETLCDGGRLAREALASNVNSPNAEREIARLHAENWQLRGALGYPVPGNIPSGNFKCGLCEARAKASNVNP